MNLQDPTTVVVFGASGDLFTKKLAPALLRLFELQYLPQKLSIVGFSRKDWTDADFRSYVNQALGGNAPEAFLNTLFFCKGDLSGKESYDGLVKYLADHDASRSNCSNKLFYLSVPPSLYQDIFSNMMTSGLAIPCKKGAGEAEAWSRVLVEKPFGTTAEGAEELDILISKTFSEKHVFLIDHYLAKETVFNILVTRFSNELFKPLWNKDHISRIEILMHESDTVSTRGAFYDTVGALRDVGQNHLVQMLAAVTMDEPKSFSAEEVRSARAHILKTLKIKNDSDVYRAQYVGYADTPGVQPETTTETYFRIKAELDHPRWKNIPIIFESGKAMPQKLTEIRIVLQPAADRICLTESCDHQNEIIFRIYPDEGLKLKVYTKKPGLMNDLVAHEMSFPLGEEAHDLAYDRVLKDAFAGDRLVFASNDEVKYSWRFVSDAVDLWKNTQMGSYQPGTLPSHGME